MTSTLQELKISLHSLSYQIQIEIYLPLFGRHIHLAFDLAHTSPFSHFFPRLASNAWILTPSTPKIIPISFSSR